MEGTLRSRTAGTLRLRRYRPVAITTPELPASASGIAMAVDTCCYVFPPLLLPSLSLRGTIAAQVGLLSVPTPELPAAASGIGTGRFTCYAMAEALCYCVPPHHEGDTLRTLTPWLH
ncbi:MAG: hypothetical protein IKX31_03580 [Muribaculaceae bacterium]|nr:hypothetical protein [Muribaculaceae bacterium]